MKNSLILIIINCVIALGFSIVTCAILRMRRTVALFLMFALYVLVAVLGNLGGILIFKGLGINDLTLLRFGFPVFLCLIVMVIVIAGRRLKE